MDMIVEQTRDLDVGGSRKLVDMDTFRKTLSEKMKKEFDAMLSKCEMESYPMSSIKYSVWSVWCTCIDSSCMKHYE